VEHSGGRKADPFGAWIRNTQLMSFRAYKCAQSGDMSLVVTAGEMPVFVNCSGKNSPVNGEAHVKPRDDILARSTDCAGTHRCAEGFSMILNTYKLNNLLDLKIQGNVCSRLSGK
jgi:hypothetical protein